MNPLFSAVVMTSLDALTARSVVTAENIANANSAGYRPRRVDFEAALKAAATRGPEAAAAVRPSIAWSQETSVRLDLELATASATSGRYGALVEILNRQLQLDALALSGGR